MHRPQCFNDIIGHGWLLDILIKHVQNNTLPHFLILEGPEGLGKTSIADLLAINLVYGEADSDERTKAVKHIIDNNQSNDYIKKFKLSVEGGKDTAKDVLSEMVDIFNLRRKKVIICDECHNLSAAAQDVFLSDTEFMKPEVYLIMLTTDVQVLRASLRSRAVSFHLYPLKQSDMMQVLKREVADRKLKIQAEDSVLSMICDWCECKPRTGLKILEAFSDGSAVSGNTIRSMIGSMDISDVLPLIQSLSGSMTFGLNYISEMPINESLINMVVECVKIKSGSQSYKLQMQQVQSIKQSLQEVPVDNVIEFLYGLTSHQPLTRTGVINAYLRAHASRELLGKSETKDALHQEIAQKSQVVREVSVTGVKAPSLPDLLANSDVIN